MGTGITASGALDFDVERVVVCEVNGDVIRAARKHFSPWLNGLFEDPRVAIYPEDGRTWLAASRERFDVVIADIFQSFKVGVGSLYTLEHYRAVRDHLEPGGLFVQWVPMFDVSEPEFAILARTMLEVFPSVTLWRRSHSPRFPVFALIGSIEETTLDPQLLDRQLTVLQSNAQLDPRTWILNIPYAAYAGNLRALEDRFAAARLNTDNRTVLEYVAPMTERNRRGEGTTRVLAWDQLLSFCDGLLRALPPGDDPYLVRLAPADLAQVRAGLAYYGYEVYSRTGEKERASAYLAEYQSLLEVAPR
jgi:spermidine synthase